MTMHTPRPTLLKLLVAVAAAAFANGTAHAQGFAVLVTPPRFELTVKPGESRREVFELTNSNSQAARLHFKTSDWSLDKAGAVLFDDALRPGSCRPWIAIERRDVTIPSGGKYRFRFDVAPPADAPAGECRFAVMVEGDEQSVQTPGGPTFPFAGRLGVIVYVTIGAAAPKLDIVKAEVATINGEATPVLQVQNSGTAHGRLSGFLSGTDAAGRKFEFNTSTLPILPGETRAITLTVNREREDAAAPKLTFPVTITGKLEWGDQTISFERRFAP